MMHTGVEHSPYCLLSIYFWRRWVWNPVLTWHMLGKYASAELSHTPSLDFVFKNVVYFVFKNVCANRR